jgi:hypothetical protein
MNQEKLKPMTPAELMRARSKEDNQVTLNRHRRLITFNIDGFQYEVDLRTIRSKSDLLQWVAHLTGKTWMNLPALRQFLKVASEACKFDLYCDLPEALDEWFTNHETITAAEFSRLDGIGERTARERLSAQVRRGVLVMRRTEGRKQFFSKRW